MAKAVQLMRKLKKKSDIKCKRHNVRFLTQLTSHGIVKLNGLINSCVREALREILIIALTVYGGTVSTIFVDWTMVELFQGDAV